MSACVCGCICVLCMYEFDMNLESFEWIKLKFNRFTSHWLRRTSPWLSVQIACFRSVIFKQKLSLAVYVRANCIATHFMSNENTPKIKNEFPCHVLAMAFDGEWRDGMCVYVWEQLGQIERKREKELNLTILVFV